MAKQKVGILYGGKSVEHTVSINSARNVFQYLDKDLYEPILMGIDPMGKWHLCHGFNHKIADQEPLNIATDLPDAYFFSGEQKIRPDIIFPVLHGTNGEDGSIQGLLQVLDIPLVGTGVLGSAISMNKYLSKQILTDKGIPTARFLTFRNHEKERIQYDQVVKTLGLPLIVKSANLGSSVGVTKVKDQASFREAVDTAFRYDHTMIIEEFIEGREIECAVMGNIEPEVSWPGEIVIKGDYEFYTFDAKYVDKNAVALHIPADVEEQTREEIMKCSKNAYIALHCEDFARVDLFLSKDNKVYVNEINTIPGFTNSSMFPMMWQQHGLSFTDLITKLIRMAFERYEKVKNIDTMYQSKLD
ncbi:MAG: D-alanine--D-alanine ligase [Cyclobacteriaceae bacterium]|nr:D-alanine--D-alanine ligase [Cyclobacteriaceae bacterium]